MFAPDGSTTGEIPQANALKAVQAGFKPAYEMTAPDGKTLGYIPADKAQDAVKAGFKPTAESHIQGFNSAGQPIVGSDAPPSTLDLYKQALLNPMGSGAASGVSGWLEQAGGRAMQGIANTVMHPIDSAKSVLALGAETSPIVGAIQALRGQPDTGPIAQRIQQFQADKTQGGLPLATANAAGDLAGAVEGGRMMGGAVQATAPAIAPAVTAAKSAVGRAALLGETPEGAYTSALKPSTTLSDAQRSNIAQTGLQNAIPVSKAGVEKIGDLIDDLNQKIKGTIAADPTRPIDPNAVATRANAVIPKFASQVNATGDLNAIRGVQQQFLQEQGAPPAPGIGPQAPAPPMNASDAQAMKQGTYRVLAGKYGEQGSASVEAQKALARGLKEEIATQFPEIGNLNAQESQLLDLQPVLERAVNRITNQQAIGIGAPIAGTAVKAATGSTGAGAVAMMMKSVLDNPAVKSRLAIAVSKASNIPPAQAIARVQAYSSALGASAGAAAASSSSGTPSQ
jgi:hypothetical protein